MSTRSTVSLNLVYALLQHASTLGIDPAKVCKAADLSFPDNPNPGTRIAAGQFYMLWMEINRQANDPNFGLRFASLSRNQPRRDILTAVMFNCPTVGTAMEKLIRYHDLATDFIKIRIRENDGTISYAWETPFEETLDRQISEAVITWLFFTLQALSNQPIPIREVHFQHPKPANTYEHQQTFNCQITFEQTRDEIVLARELLDFPVPLADPRIIQYLETILRKQFDGLYPPNTWSERVSRWISQTLLKGEQPSITSAAQVVALSTRQLQNKLKGEGTSFRDLLAQVRKEMALRYLQEGEINLNDIAFLLGFSDQSAFNHAFKRWTGISPGEYRGAN